MGENSLIGLLRWSILPAPRTASIRDNNDMRMIHGGTAGIPAGNHTCTRAVTMYKIFNIQQRSSVRIYDGTGLSNIYVSDGG